MRFGFRPPPVLIVNQLLFMWKPPLGFYFHGFWATRLRKTDFADSPAALSITSAKKKKTASLLLSPLPSSHHPSPSSCLSVQFCESAFTGHWYSTPPPPCTSLQYNSLIRQEIDVKRTQRQPELRQLKAPRLFCVRLTSSDNEAMNWELNHWINKKINKCFTLAQYFSVLALFFKKNVFQIWKSRTQRKKKVDPN